VRIDALLDAGGRQFIDLTAEHEGPGSCVPILRESAWSRDLQVAHRGFAIPGFDVPAADTMRAALDVIARKWRAMEKRSRHPNSPETPAQIAFIERWPGA